MEDAEKRELKKGVNLRVERGVNLRVERGVSQGVERGVDYYLIHNKLK